MTTTAELKSRISLRSLFEKDGVKLIPAGAHMKCLCPLHKEKTPSCHVFADGHFHCFGCGSGGDIFSYVMLKTGCTFKQVLEILDGGKAWKTLPKLPAWRDVEEKRPDFESMMREWRRETPVEKIAQFALAIGVRWESLEALRVAWASEWSGFAFPMRDEQSKIIGIRLRTIDGHKFAVKGSKQGLFIACDRTVSRRLFICEGPSDTAACISLGFTAIGRPSCNGCLDMILKFIRLGCLWIRDIVIVTDNDSPGIKGSRTLRELLTCRSYELLLPSKDLRQFVQNGGGKELIETMLANQLPRIPKTK